MALDTLGYARKLQEAGISAQQAEAHAEALRTTLEQDVATRQDIHDLRHEIENVRHEMREMASRLEARMAEMETRLLIRLGAITIGGITILGIFMGTLIALVRL